MTDANKIEYYYQPIYDTKRNHFTKAELLTRISDFSGHSVNTEDFIKEAEGSGNITAIDLQAFSHACRVFPLFRTLGIRQLHVNFSPCTCMAAGLPDRIQELLAAHRMSPDSICIEVTENQAIPDEEPFIHSVTTLHAMGFQISIDDFGKGYSGLSRMIQMPFQQFKLDKLLIDHMEQDRLARSLVRTMIGFAAQNHLTVTAEGVAAAQTARQLHRMGCHYLQGYYFSPPLPESQAAAWLNYHNPRLQKHAAQH